nr:TatD family hydrolase [uncultured Flavobacterium sp.]
MFYNLHTHVSVNRLDVFELINQYPNQVNSSLPSFSVGIHPWYIVSENLQIDLDAIESNIQLQNCLAVGECGLDKRIETDLKFQKNVFIEQIKIAEKYNKPLILHCVAAYQEAIQIKKDLKVQVPMVIHGFSKNYQVAKSLIDNGFYLSFGKYLLRNPELSDVFKQIPPERIFLETDMIEETIDLVYQKAQSAVDFDINQVVQNNFKRVFNL